ncbi:ribokinase [Saccharomonospora piscinae]|uniref:Ribokinase n=1 Tax=Saccharomonospora piscinae TaxID=687388 RepID=A0A1V9A0I7_SACPI|nr:ribokinase [Saccharomonospora piscinae]OQO90675.1 ribokinase [Saccharomonospora piscinae]TLW93345.1 ribokinase [Saccharomonospora piscinae]
MTAQLLVVGSANADLVVPAERRPSGGETVLGGDTETWPGGKGANTAVAAARLGADVALLGAVGDDAHGRLLLDSLHGSGVHTGLVRVVPRPTGLAFITVTPDGENSILVSPGANHALRPDDVASVVSEAKVAVVSMEIPLDTVERAINAAAASGTRTVLNLSPVAAVPAPTLAGVDVLLVNEHEAAWLLGSGAADGMVGTRELAGLLDLGPRAAVVTSGARGAVVVEQEGLTEVPTPAVEVVDTTGAGDAFAGALATALTRDAGLADAAASAVRVAALSVTRRGAQPSYPTAVELE